MAEEELRLHAERLKGLQAGLQEAQKALERASELQSAAEAKAFASFSWPRGSSPFPMAFYEEIRLREVALSIRELPLAAFREAFS